MQHTSMSRQAPDRTVHSPSEPTRPPAARARPGGKANGVIPRAVTGADVAGGRHPAASASVPGVLDHVPAHPSPAPRAAGALRLSDAGHPWELQAERVADALAGSHRQRAYPRGIRYPTRGGGDPAGLDRRTRAALLGVRSPPALRVLADRPGRPLDGAVRDHMERHLGHDLGHVRIHTDSTAAAATQAVDASAYTLGRHIAFAPGRYVPATAAGRHLIAHELAHVVQFRSTAGAVPAAVMRRGRTWRGFWANLFQSWDYSKETLDRYIAYLASAKQTLEDDDSDDMARQVVAEWKVDKSRYGLTPEVRTLLVREMLSGHVGNSDQEGIIDLLEGSRNAELEIMFRTGANPLTYHEIHQEFDTYAARLELFNERVLKKLGTYKAPDAATARSPGQALADVKKAYGIVFNDVSLSFQLAPAVLYESFAVDLVIPDANASVGITLTPKELSIDIRPHLFADVAWPVANAYVKGFVLRFDGLKSRLEVVGWDVVSDTANEKLRAFVADLLAGTRFADPKYDPMKDPHLIGEILDQSLIGDLERVKYNLEKHLPAGKEKKGKTPELADVVSFPTVELNLTHQPGTRLGDGKWGLLVEPGTRFKLRLNVAGSGSELMKKDASLQGLRISTSQGIVVVRGKQPIVSIDSVQMLPGLKIRLAGVHWLEDAKKILKEEFPGKFSSTVSDLAEKADSAIDVFNWVVTLGGLRGDPGPGSNVLGNTAVSLAEWVLKLVIRSTLEEHRETLQSKVGISSQQLNRFFGIERPKEKAPAAPRP